jgi:hypothetical protein
MYQVLINKSLIPLFNHLPVILEDEAVRRDQAFRFKEDETGYCHAKETESIGAVHRFGL